MSYLVSLSLDLKPASQGKYEIVNEIMSANGLFRFINSSSGNKVDLPNNTYIGEFEGEGAAKFGLTWQRLSSRLLKRKA